jgi:hypothetical protein
MKECASQNMKLINITYLFLLAVTYSTIGAEPVVADKPQVPYVLGIPVFQSESALRDWIRTRLGPTELLEFNRADRKALVALQPVGSGRITTTIYIFITDRASKNWGIATVWQTYTSKIKVSPPKGGKELTFKSKSGKILFRVPFEALEPKNDPDY